MNTEQELMAGDNVQVNADVPLTAGRIGIIASIDEETDSYIVTFLRGGDEMGFESDMLTKL